MKASSLIAACLMAAPLAMAGTAQAQDKVTYGTNWLAQAEHGGFTKRSPTAPTRSTGST